MTTRCNICHSPHHRHVGPGPVCPGGYRRDYMPGLHDSRTGQVKTQDEERKPRREREEASDA